MSDLIDRYVHQVGRYLPPRERLDIQAELRSQIQDELEDRYGTAANEEHAITILREYGHPYLLSSSYSTDKYLIGPLVYPYMMMVLRQGLLIVPAVTIFLSWFSIIASSDPASITNIVIEPLWSATQVTLMFIAVVGLFFAGIERIDFSAEEEVQDFDPKNLPAAHDPRSIDRFEIIFGIVFGVFILLLLVFFLRVGGLTLNFTINSTDDLISYPLTWMIAFIVDLSLMILLNVWILRLQHWTVALWLLEGALEAFGIICLYFVIYAPLFEHLIVPAFPNLPFLNNGPEILVVLTVIMTLGSHGSKLVRMWNSDQQSLSIQNNS